MLSSLCVSVSVRMFFVYATYMAGKYAVCLNTLSHIYTHKPHRTLEFIFLTFSFAQNAPARRISTSPIEPGGAPIHLQSPPTVNVE